MTNIKKVAAGIIAGAAITSAPLVAFAAPAVATTDTANPVGASHLQHETHVLVNSASPETRVLVNAASPASLQGGNAAHCGGTGIPC